MWSPAISPAGRPRRRDPPSHRPWAAELGSPRPSPVSALRTSSRTSNGCLFLIGVPTSMSIARISK
eukprot:11237186-Prorocentrum_lima.AAC.1